MSTKARSYVQCLSNRGYKTSLILRRVYECLPDRGALEHGMVRVIDETGEDYLFPMDLFVPVDLPKT